MSSGPKHPVCSCTVCGFAGLVGVAVGVGDGAVVAAGSGVEVGRGRVTIFDHPPNGLFAEAIALTR